MKFLIYIIGHCSSSSSLSLIVAQLILHHCFYARLMVPKGSVSFQAILNHSMIVTVSKTTIPLEAGIVLSIHIAWGCHLL